MKIFIIILSLACTAKSCFGNPSTEKENSRCLSLRAKRYLKLENTKFGALIEGASVNPSGHIFGVNFGRNTSTNQLGQVYPEQKVIYRDDFPGTFFNSIRFFNATTAFAGDANNHRILKLNIDPKTNLVTKSSVFCSDPKMIQPNDIVVSSTGFIFTSGMRFVDNNTNSDGDVWVCSPSGEARRLDLLGRTNGIELGPKEDILYVSESYNKFRKPVIQKVWKYKVNPKTGDISNRKLWIDFGEFDGSSQNDVDGMRTDVNGNLFITRHGKGEVRVFNPDGQNIASISLSFLRPTNLEFGGTKGTTLFIFGQCPEFATEGLGKGCVDYIKLGTIGAGFSRVRSTYEQCTNKP